MRMYLYLPVCICMYGYVCICMCMYVYVCVCMYYVCVGMWMYVYVCVGTCVYLHPSVCMCMYVYVCVCMCMHVYVHTQLINIHTLHPAIPVITCTQLIELYRPTGWVVTAGTGGGLFDEPLGPASHCFCLGFWGVRSRAENGIQIGHMSPPDFGRFFTQLWFTFGASQS